jgi:signal transduction histidine kinase
LRIALAIPGPGFPERLPLRWRLLGWRNDWQETDQRVIELARPPAGTLRFEAQVGHTDREWNGLMLALSFTVARHFWETPAFFTVAGCAVAGGTLLGFRQAARRREARRLAAQRHEAALAEERSRIARDMHDEVGARLSQLALMQDLILRRHASLPADTQQSLRELAVSTRETANALDQVVWAVNPLHDTLTGLAEYLAYAASSYLTPLDITCRLDAPYEWPELPVRAQVRHQLILAFREALQNVVKHSGARNVTLTMRFEAPRFSVTLADDGRGLPAERGGVGKEGLTNMRTRLASIGGTAEVRNRAAGGAEAILCADLNHAHSSTP